MGRHGACLTSSSNQARISLCTLSDPCSSSAKLGRDAILPPHPAASAAAAAAAALAAAAASGLPGAEAEPRERVGGAEGGAAGRASGLLTAEAGWEAAPPALAAPPAGRSLAGGYCRSTWKMRASLTCSGRLGRDRHCMRCRCTRPNTASASEGRPPAGATQGGAWAL